MRRALVSALMAIAAMVVPLSIPASAQEQIDCEPAVVDYTREGVLGDTDAVEQSLDPLYGVGADVRVRVFNTVPHGSLDQYLVDAIDQCASWGDIWGQKPNLVVIMFTMDDEYTLIEYGEHYLSSLDWDIDRIRVDILDSGIIAGDSAGGIAATAQEMAALIDDGPQSGPVIPPSQDFEDTPANSGEPSNFGVILFVVLLVGVGVLVVGLLLYFAVIKPLGRRRRRRKELATMFGNLEAQRQRVTDAVLLVEGSLEDEAEMSFSLLQGELDDETAESLRKQQQVAETAETAAFAAQETAKNTDGFNRNDNNEVRQSLDAWQIAADKFAIAVQLLTELKNHCDELRSRIDSAHNQLAGLVSACDHPAAQLQTARSQGYFNLGELDERLSGIRSLLVKADDEIKAKRPGHALDELAEAEQLLDELNADIEALLSVRAELIRRHEDVLSKLLEVEDQAEHVQTVLAMIKDRYDNSCWYDLAGVHAPTLVQEARNYLDQAAGYTQMKSQQWDQARDALSRAQDLLDQAAGSVQTINDLQVRLAHLELELPSKAERIGRKITEVTADAGKSKGDQDGPIGSLRESATAIEAIVRALGVAKPRLVEIELDLNDLNSLVDEVAGKVAEIHQDVMRQEQEAREREREAQEDNWGGGGFDFSPSVSPTRSRRGGGGGGGIRRSGGSSGPRGGGGHRRTGGSSGKRGG